MKKFVFILFLLCGVNLLWANDSRDEFMQDYNACKNKDEQACKKLISVFEPSCNGESLSKEHRGFACWVVAAAFGSNNEYHKAASFSQKACDLGNGGGCAVLGTLYETGEGVRQSFEKSASFFQKACDLGEGIGCFNLGIFYYNGRGVKKNKAKAKEYYGKACDLRLQQGCNNYKEMSQ
ncbi:hypothetical protein DMB95_07635 [Campylobacter sp. MIT 12-8780]|uniref:tetratricopeptide repeat protein n=1 Tax=unclassified Campylobacter TaxID=2593542 RepID=UPI00115C88A7|nr:MULTISPECIES: tetratricopeptide repeat protein [unclassified Campylobacter]NDJ27992.1 sel1 repeat family protein [Campylobacter sp. MIT 19-121]TQR40485.1 hypothetical protein DMB95_07635 [Campylobacter sp. MIT 12-8780]